GERTGRATPGCPMATSRGTRRTGRRARRKAPRVDAPFSADSRPTFPADLGPAVADVGDLSVIFPTPTPRSAREGRLAGGVDGPGSQSVLPPTAVHPRHDLRRHPRLLRPAPGVTLGGELARCVDASLAAPELLVRGVVE